MMGTGEHEVVLFVGAPFSGKTLFYEKKLKEEYMRVSAAEIYARDPHANLRIVLQKVVALLKKHHKVVIDDENSERQTRLSLINGISRKVPGTTYSCYQFVPYAGTAQLHASKEWTMGRMFLNALQHTSSVQPRALNFRHISTRIDSHSTDVIDLKLDLDRFERFKKISSPLVCFSSHKLTTPVLLVQWEGMVEVTKGDKLLRKGVSEALQKWTTANNDGNVVILFDSEGNGGHLQQDELTLLYTLLLKVQNSPPIHYVVAKESTDYGRPPNSGLVVWISYLLAASIHHKSSLYVHQSRRHQSCAEELVMRNILAKRLFSRPHTVNTVHYSEHEAHHILQNIIHINPESPDTCSTSPTPPSTSSRTLVLFHLARQLQEDSQDCSVLHAAWDMTDGDLKCRLEEPPTSFGGKLVSAEDRTGTCRVLGMVYKSFELLERFQKQWQGTLLAVTQTMVEYNPEGGEQGPPSYMTESSDDMRAGADAPSDIEQTFDPSTTIDVTSKSCSIPSSVVSRSLPEWIRENSQGSSSSQSSASSQSKHEPKRKLPQYRMTESELLATAMEYLAEHEEPSVKRHCNDSTVEDEEFPIKESVAVQEEQPAVERQDVENLRASDCTCMEPSVPGAHSDAVKGSDEQLPTTGDRLVKPVDKKFSSDSFLDELFM